MKSIFYIVLLFILILLQVGDSLSAQTPPDTLRNYTFTEQPDIDTTIDYRAHNVNIEAGSKITRLSGDAEVKYQGMQLNAGLITIDWKLNTLIAEPMLDTTATDGKNGSEPKWVGYPVFIDNGQEMSGEKIVYNFITQKGRITKGRTKFEEGYYIGSTVKLNSRDEIFVKGGTFSTCSLPDPHYYFKSSKMKMIPKDRVIAKPIVLYLRGIPLIALPYGVFPNKKGRHSGILVPRYGQSSFEGRYLRGLGYYWAASQYWDTRMEVDFFEKTGIMLHSTTNYALRYLLNGSISGSMVRKNISDTQKERRWDVNFRHSQTISPTMRISAGGSFVSDASYYQEFSANREQRLTRQIRSNATLTKSWPKSRNSLTVNLSRSQFLDTNNLTETFPQVSFRHGQEPLVNLFRSKKNSSSASNEKRWFENIYFSYNNQMLNRRSKTRSIKTSTIVQTDTSFTQTDTTFNINKFAGVEHNLSFSAPLRLFKYFSFSQNLRYEEIWQDRKKEYFLDEETNTIKSRDKNGFSVRRTFNTSISANTKLYGMFQTSRLGRVLIRHIMTPSISFQFQPDFSDPDYGYYQEIQDTLGNIVRKDRFSGSAFGSTPSRGKKSIALSLNNLFQMKTGSGENEKKVDLFSYSLSTSHNFKLDSLKWSGISSNLRVSPSRLFNLTLSMGHTFYKFGTTGQVNKFLYKENPWKPVRLTNFNISSSLRLDYKTFSFGKQATETTVDSVAGDLLDRSKPTRNRFEEAGEMRSAGKTPWQANFSFSYQVSKFNPNFPTKTIWLNMRGNMQLTKNWRVNYNARYDLKKQIMVAQDISIYRDLHCWEASFSWTPTGPYKRFYFKINIKSSLLSDIKLEKRSGRSTIFGYQ